MYIYVCTCLCLCVFPFCSYLTNRYIQAMGAFGFASQMFRMALRFYTTCNKEVSQCVCVPAGDSHS